MSQKEKLIAKLLSNSEITFEEAESLLKSFSYVRDNKGKTSGSRVVFSKENIDEEGNKTVSKILLHKPHPRKELLAYQKKQLIEQLQEEGLI